MPEQLERPKRLRYVLKCSIGDVPGAEHVTRDAGYTDDLDVACWHAEHSSYPGWDVYDLQEHSWVGGGPPREYLVREAIECLILQLTERWFQVYPYPKPHGLPEGWLETKVAEHEAKYPDWRPE